MIKYIIDNNKDIYLCNVTVDGTPTPVPIEEFNGVLSPANSQELVAPPEPPQPDDTE